MSKRDPAEMTEEERLREIASLLAAGVLKQRSDCRNDVEVNSSPTPHP